MNSVEHGRVRVEQGAKRVRAVFGGRVVADTIHPLLVWEVPYYPTYYFPMADVAARFLVQTPGTRHSPSGGTAKVASLRVGERQAADAVLEYADSPIEELRDHIRLDWDVMDSWFEEDEEIFVHPRDPRVRVDVLASSRHVRVEVDGVTVAETTSPRLLFETNLPTRYYLPKVDVRLDLLERSDTVTRCPYKGETEYYSVRIGDTVHPDLAWSYRTPLPESLKVAGLVAFTDEKVDTYVDGVRQERPETKFA